MIAYPFIYGKGRRFQYGVELISPALAPVARELETLAAYGSRTDSRSIRWGTLLGGDPYLSFAFSLPQGSAADRRAQVRVVTFVFPKDQGCPLTPALLQALPALTLAEVEALARSGDTVAAEALCPEAPSPLPPPSSDFLAAVIATLFFQKSKAGRPALLARTDPAELLAALAALPPWLLEEVSFNTDVQAVSEPLQLLNVWTEQAKQYAERTNYSGAARNQRRFFYPQEEGVRLYVDGLEREAARFLRLSPAQQDALYQDCGEDLAVLIDRLHRLEPRPHQPPCSASRPAPGPAGRRRESGRDRPDVQRPAHGSRLVFSVSVGQCPVFPGHGPAGLAGRHLGGVSYPPHPLALRPGHSAPRARRHLSKAFPPQSAPCHRRLDGPGAAGIPVWMDGHRR